MYTHTHMHTHHTHTHAHSDTHHTHTHTRESLVLQCLASQIFNRVWLARLVSLVSLARHTFSCPVNIDLSSSLCFSHSCTHHQDALHYLLSGETRSHELFGWLGCRSPSHVSRKPRPFQKGAWLQDPNCAREKRQLKLKCEEAGRRVSCVLNCFHCHVWSTEYVRLCMVKHSYTGNI